MAAEIQVRGLQDLQRSLRKVDRDLSRRLGVELAKAAHLVSADAQRKVPHLSGAARRSIKVRKSQRGAKLAVGGNAAPYFPWLDFGGRVGRGRSISRTIIPGGRYIYPTIAENREEIDEIVDGAVKTVARLAGFDQRETVT